MNKQMFGGGRDLNNKKAPSTKNKNFIYRDIKEFNIILLILIGIFIISMSSLTSYALFSYEETSPFTIKAVAGKIIKKVNLYDLVASQSLGTDTENNISYKTSSSDTNGKGVYTIANTASDEYPVYFYRGAVENNNVVFGKYCWKIVRTTSTGGVKLIYNGEYNEDNKCNNTGENSQLSETSKFNSSSSGLAFHGYYYQTLSYTSETLWTSKGTTVTSYYYGNEVTYEDGIYTLKNPTQITVSTSNDSTIYNYKYTCFTEDTQCSTVYYVYYVNYASGSGIIGAYSLPFSNGMITIQDFYNVNLLNTTPSIIATAVNTWYASEDSGMTNLTYMLENEKWCNDRSLIDTGTIFRYGAYTRRNNGTPSIECPNNNDAFTLSVEAGGVEGYGNNVLPYPVGLITADEVVYAGRSSTDYLYTGQNYWTLSPARREMLYSQYAHFRSSSITSGYVSGEYGVRPMISLKQGVKVYGAAGTTDDPYIVVLE